MNYFKRYSRFYLTDYINNPESKICWRVEAYDSISTPGILEVTAVEFYANITTDNIEEGIVDQFINKKEPQLFLTKTLNFINIRIIYTFLDFLSSYSSFVITLFFKSAAKSFNFCFNLIFVYLISFSFHLLPAPILYPL